jgi:hypothetical protein
VNAWPYFPGFKVGKILSPFFRILPFWLNLVALIINRGIRYRGTEYHYSWLCCRWLELFCSCLFCWISKGSFNNSFVEL